MRHPPSLSSLRLFLQVAYNRSFSEASRLSHVSQPALSRTIRLLEEQLDTRLFDRNSRNVALTSAGEALLPIVERLTADFDHAFSELAHSFAGERGRVVVGALPSMAAGPLPQALASFREHHPRVEVILHDHLSGNLYQQMQERQIDMAITIAPEAEGFEFERLIDDPMVLVGPTGGELDRPEPADWAVFREHTFISMAPRSSVRELTDAAFNVAGISVKGYYECTQLATVGALIAAGLGVTALPECTLGMLRGENIACRPLVNPSVVRQIGIATLAGRTLPPAAQAFRRHFLESFSQG